MRKHIAFALMGMLAAAMPAAAQDWPAKPVKIMVPFGPGSTPDVVARLIADHLQKTLGQPFVIENKPGASGNTGTDAVAKAAPDGYTIGVSIGGPLAINTLLFSKLPYDPKTDIAPITQLVTQPSALAVNSAVMVNSVGELLALLKREPGKFNFGSIGNGSLSHLAMEAIALQSGAKLVHLPYPSSPAAVTAIIRGDAQMGCLPAIAVTPHEATGALKILAVSTAKRSPYLPQIPTLKEAGIDVDADAWMGMIAPAHTPEAIVARLQRAVVEALGTAAIREKLAAQLMEPIGNSPAEFRARIDSEIVRWGPVIKAADIKVN
jgi:tripartite-type tricarboxylate transporter receptor subunit TctC